MRRADVNKRKGRMSKKHNRHARKITKQGLIKENMPVTKEGGAKKKES
jgi:hypothetical protein